ncbi:uncharacterized protein MKK02DRAFT_31037 [Dioszegia hungarica]|uniref:RRM Nup35-type domain-containing protein n=1 Tax=Dioszegia hungarica TaxID=4972 RepID=A0AA38HDG3_9TREE|nr:uncharacterized protein MKK02DRAFT_31037 [Dioszegia hungarica]KAI9638710.1 hypothetical protein MKK02DRAFT_31037 [Dioszegia hungarica]
MSDWWQAAATPSGSTPMGAGGPFTPTRPLQYSQHRSTRFNIADELDPEDARMAENIRFAPSFAASPAGKLVMGSSGHTGGRETGGMGGGGGGGGMSPGGSGQGTGGRGGEAVASPPAGARAGRSPTGRFGGESAASPRDSRRKQMTQQVIDEDMPPTASLRDTSDSPVRGFAATMAASNQLPTPPSLTASPTTTQLLIFGPPSHLLPTLEPYLSSIGAVSSYVPGPDGTNWWVVTYNSPVSAAYALRRHGEVLGGKYMIGVRVAEGVSTTAGSGWGGANGGGEGVGHGGQGQGGGGGMERNVIREKGEKRQGEWEDEGAAGAGGAGGGVSGRLADWLEWQDGKESNGKSRLV